MATFHPFPRLPLELRIQIWAQAVTHERVVRVRALRHPSTGSGGYWSPTPTPAVTRTCQESRKYCSYQPAFKIATSPRYIWVCFESDIVQMESGLVGAFAEREDSLEKTEIHHFRLEVFNTLYDASELFYHFHSHRLSDFPKLERCDVLVDDGLRQWDQCHGKAGPKVYMRFVDAKTGEWFDAESEGPYMDYMGNYIGLEQGLDIVYSRIDDDWDEENEEDVKRRYEAMVKIKEEGLPRINLDY
jgi:hypothetical protein